MRIHEGMHVSDLRGLGARHGLAERMEDGRERQPLGASFTTSFVPDRPPSAVAALGGAQPVSQTASKHPRLLHDHHDLHKLHVEGSIA